LLRTRSKDYAFFYQVVFFFFEATFTARHLEREKHHNTSIITLSSGRDRGVLASK
jgi:hypothetical protein